MSIHNAVNSFYMFDQEPSWMKSERYDYCEPADRDAVSYDSSSPDSRSAYNSVTRELKQMMLGNNQFSYTQIDRAIPEEDAE